MKKKPAYSQFIMSNNTIYTAGQLSINKDGLVIGVGDVRLQTYKALENMETVLAENGFALENIATVTIYLQDVERDFEEMDKAYRDVLKKCKPSRTTVEAKLYNPEWLIELNVIASKEVNNRVIDN